MTGKRKPPSESISSIYVAKDGMWHGRVTMGHKPDGKAVRLHRTGATRGVVLKKVRELERMRDSGQYVWTADNPTLGAWLEHWLVNVVAVKNRPKTLAGYTSRVKVHIAPFLGSVRLLDLTTEMVEQRYAEMTRDGASAHVVQGVHATLRSALSEAEKRRRVATNVARRAALARPRDVELLPLSVPETRQVLAAASGLENSARWSVALALGLRQGEALGLRKSDVDWEKGVVRVRQSMQRIRWNHGCGTRADGTHRCGCMRGGNCPQRHGGGLLQVELKTPSSRRSVPLPAALLKELTVHRARQAEARVAVGGKWQEPDLLFTTKTGGSIDPKNDALEWKALLKRAGVREVRLHDARHTAATMLLLLGVDQRTAMEVMGRYASEIGNQIPVSIVRILAGSITGLEKEIFS